MCISKRYRRYQLVLNIDVDPFNLWIYQHIDKYFNHFKDKQSLK